MWIGCSTTLLYVPWYWREFLGLCLTAPALAIPELDWRFRVGISVALGAVLIPVVEPNIIPDAGGRNPALGVIMEVLTGGVLGWSAAQIVAARAWAARS